MIWRFFKFARAFLRVGTGGKHTLLRFFVLQGRDAVQQHLQQQRKRHKILLKKFQNEFFYLELLKASLSTTYKSSSSRDFQSQFDGEEAVHVMLLPRDNYVDDLETVISGWQGSDSQSGDFHVLNQSFVQDI